MATVSAAQASSLLPVYTGGGGGRLCFTYGVYECATNLAAATIIEFCRLPRGAIVVDGFIRGDNLDTHATEELDFDIGWAANGAENADPDGFGNLGPTITGDAVTDWKPEAYIFYPFGGVLKDGPVTFTRETVVQAVINTDAATGGTGTLYCGVYYLVP